jgi:hypothetical protein
MRVAREKLYQEVWAEPMTTVAKRYDVSSNYLARICERLNIPRPGRGYWQQHAVGAEVEADVLPAAEPGDEVEWARDGSTPAIAQMSSASRRPVTRAARPEKHSLLVDARGLFDDVRGGREVLYVLPRKTKLVDIFVTPATLERALKFASDFFLFAEERGHRVVLAPTGRGYTRKAPNVHEGVQSRHDYGDYQRGTWQPISPTTVLVGDIAIGVTIYETMEEADAVWRNGKYVRHEPPKALPATRRRAQVLGQEHVTKHWFPTGRLGLQAYASQGVAWEQTWIEKAAGELSASFEAIAKALEGAVPKIRTLLDERAREEERRKQEWAEQQKRWRREEEERRRKEEEAARVKRIQEDIASWRTARDIRAYVAEIQALVKDADLSITEGGSADQDLKWALNYADAIDPLASWRKDIERVKAEAANRPRPNCGQTHSLGGEAKDSSEHVEGTSAAAADLEGAGRGPDVT